MTDNIFRYPFTQQITYWAPLCQELGTRLWEKHRTCCPQRTDILEAGFQRGSHLVQPWPTGDWLRNWVLLCVNQFFPVTHCSAARGVMGTGLVEMVTMWLRISESSHYLGEHVSKCDSLCSWIPCDSCVWIKEGVKNQRRRTAMANSTRF